MAVVIDSLPATISRADYLRLIESVGINPNDCQELTFGLNSITATVFARDERGRCFAEGGHIATHEITIRVED